ncbi:MAG: zinc-binding alcohol dehydrogenase [Anaerolineales bacterium]|nr:zinc-binding alcohol dehydrogenase [Anaerolineales bacterium]MCB0005659.1 zinc-binding alcohol dehydrogenase [Anaerolineales bacterium]MCB0011105.1 zinc-binding alcohol dehydrogenase [Anaerolineales bacterium]MCB0018457.1 zinc-binding alcohol dehydrogenase [Anaerolineales bacterium]MCB8960916.1 zinc-binding alcohol dehydrogenase [Ardenticatenales bacterium]
MKIAILHGPRQLTIEEQPLDASRLAPDEIWIKTQISAFKIGTDRGNYEGAEDVPGAPTYPRWVGDSNLGIVQGIGSAVTRVKVGDTVVTRQPHQSEYITKESASMVRVPPGVDPEDAVYAHLYALSAHCYRKAQFQPGENVAVVGVGLLGLGAIALGPLFGARVVAIANSPLRLEMAAQMGAHAGFLSSDPDLKTKLNEFTDGQGIDLVILTANPWPAFRTALDIVRENGRVSIVSLLGRGELPLDFNPLPMELFYIKGISLFAVSGPAGYLFPNSGSSAFDMQNRWAADRSAAHVLSLMADGRLKPSQLITHRFHYSEMRQAYEMAYEREKSMLGVIFDWRD